MEKIKALIVDDSFFMITALKTILETDPTIEVLDTAKNGLEAISKIKDLRPDVVTIDINMPYIDGIKSIQLIMNECPVPIIVISAYTTDRESEKTVAALSAGAVDYIGKPDGEVSTAISKYAEQIIRKVKVAAAANVKNIPISVKSSSIKITPPVHSAVENIVLVGVSTGGPSTLKQLFSSLKPNLNISIVAAIHITDLYLDKLCALINDVSSYNVVAAQNDEPLQNGTIYLCSSGRNYEISSHLRIRYTSYFPNQIYMPSVDVLFSSAAKNIKGKKILGIVLTGMGNDGSKGIVDIYNAGGITVVQDEKTSVIYGMPKTAKLTKKYHYENSLNDLPGLIEKFALKRLRA